MNLFNAVVTEHNVKCQMMASHFTYFTNNTSCGNILWNPESEKLFIEHAQKHLAGMLYNTPVFKIAGGVTSIVNVRCEDCGIIEGYNGVSIPDEQWSRFLEEIQS